MSLSAVERIALSRPMSTLSFLDRNVLWITAPLMCISVLLLGLFIWKVVRLVIESKILNVPLVEQQNIELPEAGRLVLAEEGPRFSNRFSGLSYELRTDNGTPVQGQRALFRATTAAITTVRREVMVYEVPHPGRFVLRVQGLGAARQGDAKNRLVFTRPHLAQSMMYVVGITLSGCVFVASLVFFLLRLMGVDSQ